VVAGNALKPCVQQAAYLCLLKVALLQDLLDGLLLVVSAKLVLKSGLRGGVELALCALPELPVSIRFIQVQWLKHIRQGKGNWILGQHL
jgi:hypothetical protein